MAQACEGTLRAPVHSQAAAEDVERGRGDFVFMWQSEKVRRKGGHQIGPEELAKTFQFMRNILQAKAPGESALSICLVTGPHPSSARKSRTQPIRIHWRFWAFSKPQSGKMHLKTQRAGSHLCGCITTTYCTVILLNESRCERPWDWNARMADGILLHSISKRLPLIESADTAFRGD